MSWIIDSSLTWVQRLCVKILKTGPIPRHVAFIMDGNRRYAKKTNVHKIEGHTKGFDKLAECLQWCLDLGIPEVTVYAFSIENFKRSDDEVSKLMELAKEKFEKLLEEKDKIMEQGVCIRVIGNLSLLDEDLRRVIAQAIVMTKNNSRAFLNIAFAYTSRDEITNSIKSIVEGVESGLIEETDIDEQLISNCLYTNKSFDPDLLIRTSGEVRFSDFLLWQIQNAQVCFADVLWPEFCIWHLLAAVFNYQRHYQNMQSVKNTRVILENRISKNSPRVAKFLEHMNQCRAKQIESYAQA